MKSRTFFLLVVAIITLCLASSCSNQDKNAVQYYPFQSERDGKWGMISPNGKVLFEDEFSECPSFMTNDRFTVENKNGLWEIYKWDGKRVITVGEEYKGVSSFYNNRAFAVRSNNYIEIIDKDGKVLKTLDKIEGKTVEAVGKVINCGITCFKTTEDLFGVIDVKGNVICKPNYKRVHVLSNGNFLTSGEDNVVTLYNNSGNILYEFSDKEIIDIRTNSLDNNLMCVNVKKGDEFYPSIMTTKGSYKVEPLKNYGIEEIYSNGFVFCKDWLCGVQDFKGNVIFRPKYETLVVLNAKGTRFAVNVNDDDDLYRIIDQNGEKVFAEDFYDMQKLSNEYFAVETSKNDWEIINLDGKTIKKKVSIYNIYTDLSHNDDLIESDYIDIDEFVSSLNISADNIDGLKITSSTRDVVKHFLTKQNSSISCDPKYFTRRDEMKYSVTKSKISITYGFYYQYRYIAYEKTHQERRGHYYTYYETVTDGYYFTEQHPDWFYMKISMEGKLEGKQDMVFKALSQRIKSFDVQDITEEDGDICVQLANGNKVCVLQNNDADLLVGWYPKH